MLGKCEYQIVLVLAKPKANFCQSLIQCYYNVFDSYYMFQFIQKLNSQGEDVEIIAETDEWDKSSFLRDKTSRQ